MILQTQDTYHIQSFQEKQYAKLAAEMSGHSYNVDLWEKQQKQQDHLEQQSKRVAEKLNIGFMQYGLGWKRRLSFNPYRESNLWILGLHTKGVKKLDNYQNWSIIPVKARQQRAPTNKELQYFLSKNPYTRMYLFTDKRQTLVNLRSVMKTMHRRLSKLNGHKFMKKIGAQFVFRTTELGEIFPIGNDDISVHPHMHALMVLKRKLTRAQFITLNKFIKCYWKAYCADSGIIRNARELTKYIVKPNDLDALNAEQTCKLYLVQKGIHHVQPLGKFRVMKKQISDSNAKVIIRKGEPKIVPNWNRSTTNQSKADPVDEYLDCLEDQTKATSLRESIHDAPRRVAWCTPSPIFTPVTEPCFMVLGLTGRDPIEMFDKEDVIKMEHAINVHTNTLTVQRFNQNTKQQDNNYESEPKKPPKYTSTSSIR
jgi:hypothetical protein